ncbi:1-acylglycerol-3-phosphate O-acyltransferase [Tilletia horrida]|nr:1-acylglycerol-3-phosphate O-acyltransferase [Tilletia horrida]
MAVVTRTITYSLTSTLVILTLLAPRSRKARFYLNVVLYTLGLGACSIWGVIVSVLMALIPGQRLNINKVVARSFYYLTGTLTGVRFQVEGEENFEKARPAVLVGNHQSSIDILYLGRIFPAYASIMAKKELKYSPLLGQFMTLSGAVFINRKNRKDAVKAMDMVGKSMKKRNLSLWIFPEGTRSNLPVPDLLPFKKGAFHLAIQAQVPIVPVVCENYYRIFDSKSRFDSGTIRIKVLPPIETTGLTSEDAGKLSDKVREQMLATLRAFDADQERADVPAISANATPEQKQLQRAEAGDPLGGLARLASFIVGRGKGTDWDKKVAKDRAALTKPGTKGLEPGDYGLVSEGEKSREQATASSSGVKANPTA